MRASSVSSDNYEDEQEEEEPRSTKRASTSTLDDKVSKRGKASKAGQNDKEARKAARMLRNRHAAQASRDRKKEHTQLLEQRIAELEAQLDGEPIVSVTHRAPSATSSSGSLSTASSRRLVQLEQENHSLKNQLDLEQKETLRLRKRLENLESKFGRLEHMMSEQAPLSAVRTSLLSPTLSLSSLPLDDLPEDLAPSFFEPTFSFTDEDRVSLEAGSPLSMKLEYEEERMEILQDETKSKTINERLFAREVDLQRPLIQLLSYQVVSFLLLNFYLPFHLFLHPLLVWTFPLWTFLISMINLRMHGKNGLMELSLKMNQWKKNPIYLNSFMIPILSVRV